MNVVHLVKCAVDVCVLMCVKMYTHEMCKGLFACNLATMQAAP